jgi:hypothetical protein
MKKLGATIAHYFILLFEDSGDRNDVDLLSNIAADDESDYGIDSHDKSSTK